ncbi:MAG: phytanoyl-CoA dioxygenase family protein [Bdellovibrionaceae bacterium]|nr:phytanoyl-CoA dioxygenase family protein [Pseudobdellovibrionaceae bacterium]
MVNFREKVPFLKSDLDKVYNDVSQKGYSLIPQVLNSNEIETFKDQVIKAIENFQVQDNPYREKEKYHIHDLLLQSPDFAKLFEDPRLQQLLSLFLGPYWILYAFTSSSVPPMGGNYAKRIHNDCPRNIPNYITNMGVIWPLDDYTSQNGCLQVLPESHIGEGNFNEEYFNKNYVPVYCQKGALIIFNARLIHRTDVNKTSNFRHALTLNACRHYMKARFDWPRMIPKNYCENLNSQAMRILGFDSRIPCSLDEYFVPPEKRLYKAGQE